MSDKVLGIVEHRWLDGGSPVSSRSGKVFCSIDEVHFIEDIPEVGKGEAQISFQFETRDDEGGKVESSWNSGVFRYVKKGSRLPIRDRLIFDGKVGDFLNIAVEIQEIDRPSKEESGSGKQSKGRPEEAGENVRSARDEAKEALISGLSGAIKSAGAIWKVFNALLRLNADDQLLEYQTSLYRQEAASGKIGPESLLKEGRLRIMKRGTGRGNKAGKDLLAVTLRFWMQSGRSGNE